MAPIATMGNPWYRKPFHHDLLSFFCSKNGRIHRLVRMIRFLLSQKTMVKVSNTVRRLRQTFERLHLTSVLVGTGIQNRPNTPIDAWQHDLGNHCNKGKKRFDGHRYTPDSDFDPFSHLKFDFPDACRSIAKIPPIGIIA